MENNKKELGSSIAALRKVQGVTREEVAAAAGMTAAYLQRIEEGDADPTLKALRRVAKALGVPTTLLVSDNVLDDYARMVMTQASLTDERPMLYRLRTDMRQGEEGNWHLVYGIDAYRHVQSIPDIFTERGDALALLELCEQLQPMPEHLTDIVQDRIAQ